MNLSDTYIPHVIPDQAVLNSMSRKLVSQCPDMREMARDAARNILSKHNLQSLEPDTVYWHRFDRTLSSPLTFNGWKHQDKPIESLTLPQLVMHRFSANDQDNIDQLQMMGGFYTAGPDAEAFDETNEVRLLPADVLDQFWSLDFKNRFYARMTAFWKACSDDFRTLAKANFIGKAIEDHESGTLNVEQFEALMAALGIGTDAQVTVEMLQSEQTIGDGVRIAALDIGGYEASDILRIVESSGRQFLYLPGETDAFHVFDTPNDLQWWLMTHTDQARNRAQFMSHFPISMHADSDHKIGLNHAIDLMFSHWGPHASPVINTTDRTVTKDAFTHLRDATQARMQADADFALYSNGELRKQMWMGYLRAFGETFGAMAAVDWPVTLAVVGAGLADVGLSIDQAVTGHTTADRERGVIAAITGSIDVLFNSLFLFGPPEGDVFEAAAGNETPEAPAPGVVAEKPPILGEKEILEPGPTYPDHQLELLAPFETNELIDGLGAPGTEGRMRGVYTNERGGTYISIDGFAYQVRYVNELNTWVIIDPENPFSFYRNVPVRLNDEGQWILLGRSGLRGGGRGIWPWGNKPVKTPGEALPSRYDISSDFREPLRPIMENSNDNPFKGYMVPGEDQAPMNTFFAMRESLRSDTEAFFENPVIPERPSIPVIEPDSPPKLAFKQLYEDTQGVVIGENHSAVSSKRFLMDNMQLLVKQKVRTLYLEHLMTDLHQADLDVYAKTGKMPQTLESYLKYLDDGHHTDPTGKYSFLNLVKEANKNHMRIRAIDCMASYRLAGMDGPSTPLRVKVMNYFAHNVIAADQAASGGGKWIALVGNSHANTYEGIPGVAELERGIGIRCQDVAPGEAHGIDVDPGQDVQSAIGKPLGRVKSDLRLRMEVVGKKPNTVTVEPVGRPLPPVTPSQAPLESRLTRPGTFLFDGNADASELIHRSADGQLVHTPIQFDGRRLYIDRPKWKRVTGRRYDSFSELAMALQLQGMKQVA